MPSNPAPKETVVKHRACDECRTRKLACSKNPDGCERCKRDGLNCHYSEQKQMGRPRKRQFIEAMKDNIADDIIEETLGKGPLPFAIDNLKYSVGPMAAPYYTNINSGLGFPVELDGLVGVSTPNEGRGVWQFGDQQILGTAPIDFSGDLNFGHDPSPSTDLPHLSSTSHTSPTLDSRNSPPQSSAPCSCLASMYLALSSMQQLPTDIVQALRTVRGATQTATNTIWCPQCGSIILEQKKPIIDAFQNIMLLGTFLPIIAYGYHKLLTMIDNETDAAIAAGQTRLFKFREYGGLCKPQKDIAGEMTCIEKELLFTNVEMPPMQWRNTVRALLRVDIYGHEHNNFKHKGLKDLIAEIESRQILRHKWLEQFPEPELADGGLGPFTCDKPHYLGVQTHGCVQILQIAKIAIDSIIIP